MTTADTSPEQDPGAGGPGGRRPTTIVDSRSVGRDIVPDVLRPGGDRPLVLVFDGYCGFCTRSVRLIKRLDRHGRIDVIAGQHPGAEVASGVTIDESLAAAWAVLPDGRRTPGAPAIAVAVGVALGTRLPLLPWRVPGLPGLLDRAYQWIADNRRRFRGDTPWCEQRPDAGCRRDQFGH